MAVTQAPLAGDTASHRVRNFALLFASGSISIVGMSLVSSVTIMPLFMSHLTDSLILVGAVPAVWGLSFTLPQALGPGIYEGKPVKKSHIARHLFFGSAVFMAFGGVVVAAAEDHRIIVLLLFFPAVLAFMGSIGLAHTAWIDVIGKVIDPRVQSRFLGSSHAAGGLLGAAAITLASRLMGDNAFPNGFGFSMVVAGGLFAAGASLFFLLVEQPTTPRKRSGLGFVETIKGIPALYRADRVFLRYGASRVVVMWGMSAFAFFTVFAVRDLGASDADAVRLAAVLVASQLIGSLGFGALGDRVSARWMPLYGSIIAVTGLLVAFLTGSIAGIYIAICAAGLTMSTFMISEVSVILHLSPSARRPTYYATHSLTSGLFIVAAPIAAGALVSAVGFTAMFGVAAVVSLVGVLLTAEFARAAARRNPPSATIVGGGQGVSIDSRYP
ncbi:MAG: MFS transporter [Chloroflexi bacterium]|nr:MFS transporter [Chloroflexota bacterium]